MIKILNIFGFYPAGLEHEFMKQTKVGLDFAANNLQKAIIKGYEENGISYHIINAPFVGAFPPYYKKAIVPSYVSQDGKVNSVEYLNITLVKRLSIINSIKKEAIQWCDKNADKNTVILFYSFSYIKLAKILKKKYPFIKCCLLVTDLPEFMASNRSFLTRLNSFISLFIPKSNFDNSFDGYILLADLMKLRLPIGSKPYIIMEGIFNNTDKYDFPYKERERVILYTGNLGQRYGLIDLFNAFENIPKSNYRLWLCGTGDTVDYIKDLEKRDKRVKYWGMVNREKIFELQRRATVLINPRHSNEEYTKYSFPSKTMEYMASGTPTLMCSLASLPELYKEHLYIFEDESVEGMSKKIEEICDKPQEELDSFGRSAAEFIMNYKTPKPQVKKIFDFFYRLLL